MIDIFMKNFFSFTRLQLFVYFYEHFCFENLTSDMVQIFQSDYVENMCFEFFFNNCIHHIEILGPSQTWLIFLIYFMSLSWHHGSQEKFYLKHSQNEETRNSDFKKSISQYVSYQTFDRNSSIHDKMTKKNCKNLESL